MSELKNVLFDLPPQNYEQLKKMKLHKIGAFLGKVNDKKSRFTLARVLKVEEKQVEQWVKQLELYRLNSLDDQMIKTFKLLGIHTLKDIAKRSANELYELLKTTKEKTRITLAYLDEVISEARFSSMRMA